MSSGLTRAVDLLAKMKIVPCEESVDYVSNKTQFQLHTLLTEKRHSKTWNLSSVIQEDVQAGLQALLSVDDDISQMLMNLPTESLVQAKKAMVRAIKSGHKIYFYGCGSTGRLAKLMESTFWRPFWQRCKQHKEIWGKITNAYGDNLSNRLIGEMTGADRALISSLEGFEDLQLIGQLQLEEHGIVKGDAVFCVTEGGETSSVIGTIRAARDQWSEADRAKEHLFFIYNNPEECLLPFERSRSVLQEEGITKINLTTGSQAIAGSTRMQATTSETYVLANVMHFALEELLADVLTEKEMQTLGFAEPFSFKERFDTFAQVLHRVKEAIPQIAELTTLESQTYQNHRFSTYFAKEALITVFIDGTERSPTFRLNALDTIEQKSRRCWIQVWTQAEDQQAAWHAFLGRSFKGLSHKHYNKPFTMQIDDPFLKSVALKSLEKAGDEQQELYDFSFGEFNINRQGDLGVLVLTASEIEELENPESSFHKFCKLFQRDKALGIIAVTDKKEMDMPNSAFIGINISTLNDPLGINEQIALKIILNTHSTGVMALLDKVVGNTMTHVQPSNLKLIGRATFLIQSHVNDVLQRTAWASPITYAEANAVLYKSKRYIAELPAQQAAEVGLSIIHILETLKHNRRITQDEAFKILSEQGLRAYLKKL